MDTSAEQVDTRSPGHRGQGPTSAPLPALRETQEGGSPNAKSILQTLNSQHTQMPFQGHGLKKRAETLTHRRQLATHACSRQLTHSHPRTTYCSLDPPAVGKQQQ